MIFDDVEVKEDDEFLIEKNIKKDITEENEEDSEKEEEEEIIKIEEEKINSEEINKIESNVDTTVIKVSTIIIKI